MNRGFYLALLFQSICVVSSYTNTTTNVTNLEYDPEYLANLYNNYLIFLEVYCNRINNMSSDHYIEYYTIEDTNK